ncbi:glycohydrolase toxin TNT-related protein [Bacillus nitratireducens]|uniref:glycohydrolase toxin TNT-related protein n=1 Tax=Bacillus nitratireducens TaxID=2026193 RepID=UPI002E7704C8|nr:glycohydrolase toxin TNT-related protein [Bacillus nitratireducens]
MISPSMPKSQFDEKLVAASKELEDTIQKVQQFESKKGKRNAENILDALNKQVQIAGKMSSLFYTNSQLQAEREMMKKQEKWAEHHPVEVWIQNFSNVVGEKWDVLGKGTKWVGENFPLLKGLSDDALVLEGFIGAELSEWGYNSIRGVETEQWPEEVQIPKNSDVLRVDGYIDWGRVPNDGYVVNKDGKVMKDEYTLKIGEVNDRYGPSNGTYTSPVANGKPYSYDERALPYLEDVSKYPQYEVVGDFSNVKTYIDNCSDSTLTAQVDAAIQKYNCGDYSKLKAQIGEVAPGFGTIKGGTQIQLPLMVEQLKGLKLLKQIK